MTCATRHALTPQLCPPALAPNTAQVTSCAGEGGDCAPRNWLYQPTLLVMSPTTKAVLKQLRVTSYPPPSPSGVSYPATKYCSTLSV